MIPLYSGSEFDTAKSFDKLPCKCYRCGSAFYRPKKEINYELKHKRGNLKYCSTICINLTKQSVTCLNCNNIFEKQVNKIKRYPNHFCSHSCSAKYYNKNKKHGNRRSKLEEYVESQLKNLYPTMQINYNDIKTIGMELDIYIPSLNIAFELNGIFHYEPIFGEHKLEKRKIIDNNKYLKCIENTIDLCIIDTSQQKRFTEKSSQKYLNIITDIINQRTLLTS